jgi:nucleotide-binding universal stress UspA family protein
VHAITVWESPAVLSGPAPILTQPDLTPNRVREQHWHDLTDVVEACVAGASTPELTTELVEGNAAEVLVNRAAHACMLVLGDRGRGRMSGSTLGSVALHCIHKAHCPVLILPAGMGSANHPGDAQPRAAIDPVLG